MRPAILVALGYGALLAGHWSGWPLLVAGWIAHALETFPTTYRTRPGV
jgi:hypothetical protein